MDFSPCFSSFPSSPLFPPLRMDSSTETSGLQINKIIIYYKTQTPSELQFHDYYRLRDHPQSLITFSVSLLTFTQTTTVTFLRLQASKTFSVSQATTTIELTTPVDLAQRIVINYQQMWCQHRVFRFQHGGNK